MRFLIETAVWLVLGVAVPILAWTLASKTQPGMAQMAQVGNLSQRVRGILDKSRPRGASRWQKSIGLLVIVAVITPITTLGQGGQTSKTARALASDDVTLTIGLPEDFFGSLDRQTLYLDEFEAAHPGVTVVLRRDDSGYLEDTMAGDPAAYLEEMADFADGADVLFNWTSSYLTPVATRAGLFLNLAPAIAADADLDINRYFPAAWASYQWDGGMWGMPTMLDPVFVVYSRSAFDAAGLTYPDENWTMDQFVAAARTLTSTDADGNTIPGLTGDPTFLFRALLGRPFYHMVDPTQAPDFAGDAELMALAEQWLALKQEGAAAVDSYYATAAPLQITSSWAMFGMQRNGADDAEWAAALLPGGVAGLLNVGGFVVSAGTQAPQVAYELAKHLSLISNYLDTLPIAAMSAVVEAGGGLELASAHFYPGKDEAQRAADFNAAQHALPLTEHIMAPFLMQALSAESGLEAGLATADAQAATALALADEMRSTLVLSIPPERPPVEVPPGQVALQFHMASARESIPNFDEWEQAAADFAAQDDEVFSVDLMTGWGIEEGQQPDCYLVANYFDSNNVLPLEPLMAADPNFDEADFAPGALDAMRLNGQVIAYPLVVQPEMLWVDMDVLQQVGVAPQGMDWDISTFVEAITAVKDAGLADYGFGAQSDARLNWLMLMMAYGGLPVDYSTSPATVNLTDPASVDAIQRVLDLVKGGYIGENLQMSNPPKTAGVTTETVFDVPYHLGQQANHTLEGNFRLMNYPAGSQYTPLSYLAQGASIAPNSQHVEACYRWISYLATRPDLMLGLPAQRSQLDNPLLTAAYGPDTVQAFRDYYARLDSANARLMPFYWTDDVSLDTAVSTWINRAFDAYVKDDADLNTVLTTAQSKIDDYHTCMAGVKIPNYMDTTMEEVTAYQDQVKLCLQGVDPDLLTQEPFSSMFSAN